MILIPDSLRPKVEYELRRANGIYGTGMVLAIIWGTAYAGCNQSNSGVVVRQNQYGMRSSGFTISSDHTRVKFLGRWHFISGRTD